MLDLLRARLLDLTKAKTAGFNEGEKASKMEIAQNLLNINTPIKDIIKVTGLSKKEVDSLKD